MLLQLHLLQWQHSQLCFLTDSAHGPPPSSRRAAGGEWVFVSEMSCSTWRMWVRQLLMQGCTFPSLSSLPLSTSCHLLDFSGCSSRFQSQQHWVHWGPWDELRAVCGGSICPQLQILHFSILILWALNLLSSKTWLPASAHIVSFY